MSGMILKVLLRLNHEPGTQNPAPTHGQVTALCRSRLIQTWPLRVFIIIRELVDRTG